MLLLSAKVYEPGFLPLTHEQFAQCIEEPIYGKFPTSVEYFYEVVLTLTIIYTLA